jgi:small GTP-binding protein
MPANHHVKSKVCLVGEAAVGKTSLVRRYVLDEFDDKYITTLGAKVSKKEMEYEYPEKDAHVDMDMTIWDIMGEKGFRDLLKDAYFQGAKGVIAVCDITRISTVKELDDWIKSVFEVVGEVPVIYAVNKNDLRDEVMLMFTEKDLLQWTRAFDAQYFYTSAKTGENVEKAFKALGSAIIAKSGVL